MTNRNWEDGAKSLLEHRRTPRNASMLAIKGVTKKGLVMIEYNRQIYPLHAFHWIRILIVTI